MKVKIIFTCYNRKEKTLRCINQLLKNNAEIEFVIVDDNSSDGTSDAINKLDIDKVLLKGSGSLFWAGGMRLGIQYVLDNGTKADYIMLVNDDVDFYSHSLDKMIDYAEEMQGAVIVGNCCDKEGRPSYGAIKMNRFLKKPMYYHLGINNSKTEADTFNCNAVLIKTEIVQEIGNFDPVYSHNFADYDYGFMIRKRGYRVFGTDFYVGECTNDKEGKIWSDPSCSRKERLINKETPKGLPQKEWNHFLLKNLGIFFFLRYAYSPIIRILLGK